MNSLIAFRRIMILTVAANTASAQPPSIAAGVRGESPGTRARLVTAEQLLRDGHAAAARTALAKIIDEAGDDLIQQSEGSYISARLFAHTLLTRLPPDQLNNYRDRIDPLASVMLEKGKARRSASLLRDAVERYFVSRPAATALLLLGELAFERGEFAAAERDWTRLIPGSIDSHPGPIENLPVVKAQIVLAIGRQNDPSRTTRVAAEFAKEFPDKRGFVAGREGKLVEILHQELAKISRLPQALTTSADWRCLGADASRSGAVSGSVLALPRTPAWIAPIASEASRPSRRRGTARRVAFHPALDERHVFFSDGQRINRLEVATGHTAVVFDIAALEVAAKMQPRLRQPWTDADFSLMIDRGKITARLGAISVIPDSVEADLASHLVCVSQAAGVTQLHWSRPPPVAAGILAGWEGSPLAIDRKVYAVFTRLDGGRVVQAIACYGDDKLPLWTCDVCEIGLGSVLSRERHELLTLADSAVVFASHTGVVAAVNRHSGKPLWSFRYPQTAAVAGGNRHRDLSPPVSSEGQVFVAPADSDRLYGLDAETGKVLWQSDALTVDHIIGVSAGKVIAAIAAPQHGLRAFDARTGSTEPGFGWQQHDDPTLAAYGRGAIVGDHIAWPTQDGLYYIRLADGYPAAPLLRNVHGNIAFADGRLVVADAHYISLYAHSSDQMPPLMVPQRVEDLQPKLTLNSIDPNITFSKPRPAVLNPLLTDASTLTVMATAPANTTYQPPARREWGVSAGRPALLASSTPVDAVEYDQGTAFVADGTVLSRRDLAGADLWKLELHQEILSLQLSPQFGLQVRLNSHQFVAVSPKSGTVMRIHPASSHPVIAPYPIESAPDYDPLFLTTLRGNVVTRRGDECQYNFGIEEWPCGTAAWTTPPVELERGRFAFSSGPGRVSIVEDRPPFQKWIYESPWTASLAGTAPQCRTAGEFLDVHLERNHGGELLRLDSEARPVWRAPAFLDSTITLTNAASDRRTLYLPGRDSITALDAVDGRRRWTASLPYASDWHLFAFENAVVAVPIGLTPPSRVRNFPLGRLVQFTAALVNAPSTIVVLKHESGEVKSTVAVSDGPIIAATLQPDGLWLATPRTIYRLH